jgi:hypothetical protein
MGLMAIEQERQRVISRVRNILNPPAKPPDPPTEKPSQPIDKERLEEIKASFRKKMSR